MPDLRQRPIHLGREARASIEPPFTGFEWYAAYAERHAADGAEGRLVAVHTFDTPWSSWEMHPEGDEVVVCLEGRLTLIQVIDGVAVRRVLEPFDTAINVAGVWHTADVEEPTVALFITAGKGTENRLREGNTLPEV